MIEKILGDADLFWAVRRDCCENGVGVSFADDLKTALDDLDDSRVVIVKVDHLYSTTRMHNPPKAIDCLIIVKCCTEDKYDVYLIELRNVSKPRYAHPREISEKFATVINDMFNVTYREVFSELEHKVRSLKCYLVTDPYKAKNKGLSDDEVRALYAGTALDAYGSLDPIEFGGHFVPIEVMLPDPLISAC